MGPGLASAGHALPQALQGVPAAVLEEYVQGRIAGFIDVFAQRLMHHEPQLKPPVVQQAIAEAATLLTGNGNLPAPVPQPEVQKVIYQLVFRHDCMALGCLDPQCTLCQHNPQRRCTVNFDRKYLVNDVLKAKCGAHIRVELTDAATGALVDTDTQGMRLEVCVLDGHAYDTKFVEAGRSLDAAGQEAEDDLEACVLLLNKKKNTPLLVAGGNASNDTSGRLLLPMQHGRAVLMDLSITDSSEAILLGRKPPFRLLVKAAWGPSVSSNGSAMGRQGSSSSSPGPPGVVVRHAISEGFVVATRRTRTAGKVDIPSVDDPVGKLEHMGKETVKKLSDLRSAALQAGVDISIPENSVTKVGEFKLLALRADQDGHLRQRLQHVLKLSKEKWEEAREHALRAVVADSRLRAWYVDPLTCQLGLLFGCRLGSVDLDRPQALLQLVPAVQHSNSGASATGAPPMRLEATLMAQLSPAQRDLVRQLLPRAAHSWWWGGHPGWAIFTPPPDADPHLLGVLAALAAHMEGNAGSHGNSTSGSMADGLLALVGLRASSAGTSMPGLPGMLPGNMLLPQLLAGGGSMSGAGQGQGLLVPPPALPLLAQAAGATGPRQNTGSTSGAGRPNPFASVARQNTSHGATAPHPHTPAGHAGQGGNAGGAGFGAAGSPAGLQRLSTSSTGAAMSHLTKRSAQEMSGTTTTSQGYEAAAQPRARTSTSAASAPLPATSLGLAHTPTATAATPGGAASMSRGMGHGPQPGQGQQQHHRQYSAGSLGGGPTVEQEGGKPVGSRQDSGQTIGSAPQQPPHQAGQQQGLGRTSPQLQQQGCDYRIPTPTPQQGLGPDVAAGSTPRAAPDEPPNPFASLAAVAHVIGYDGTSPKGLLQPGAAQGGAGTPHMASPNTAGLQQQQQQQPRGGVMGGQVAGRSGGGAGQPAGEGAGGETGRSLDLGNLPSLPFQPHMLQQVLRGGGLPGVGLPGGEGGTQMTGSAAELIKNLPSLGVTSFLNSTELDAMLSNLGGGGGGGLPSNMETSLTVGLMSLTNSLATNLAPGFPGMLDLQALTQQLGQQGQGPADQQQPRQSNGGSLNLNAANELSWLNILTQQQRGLQARGEGTREGTEGGAGGDDEPAEMALGGVASGLDNMQSIEQALPEVGGEVAFQLMAAAQQQAAKWKQDPAHSGGS